MTLSFTPKDWKSFPDTSTPVNQASLEDLETRVTNFATLSAVYEAKAHGPVLNVVTDYGADNTGAANANTAIQNAINAVGSGGGTVYIPDGTYLIGATIFIPSNVTLLGHVQSVLKASVALGATSWVRNTGLNVSANNNITLQNVIFDGNISQRAAAVGDPGASANLGFHGAADSTPCTNISMIDCEIRNFPGIAISFRDCKGIKVVGNWVHDGTRDSIHLSHNINDGVIVRNYIVNTGDDQIAVHGGESSVQSTSNIVVANNICDTTTRPATAAILFSNVRDCIAIGNTCNAGWNSGISVHPEETRPSSNVVIANNVITSSGSGNVGDGDGIFINNGQNNFYVDDTTQPTKGVLQDITIVGNIITSSKRNGINLNGRNSTSPIRGFTIQGNAINGAVVGIQMNGACYEGVISGNRVAATTAFGWGANLAIGVLLSGNSFKGSGASYAGTYSTTNNKKHANILHNSATTFEHGDT